MFLIFTSSLDKLILMNYEMQKRVNIEQKCGEMEALPNCRYLEHLNKRLILIAITVHKDLYDNLIC